MRTGRVIDGLAWLGGWIERDVLNGGIIQLLLIYFLGIPRGYALPFFLFFSSEVVQGRIRVHEVRNAIPRRFPALVLFCLIHDDRRRVMRIMQIAARQYGNRG